MSTSTTTARELESNRSHRLAFVIIFEGVGLALTTSEDVPGISTAWAGTEWANTNATWFPSAFLPGSWSQQIEVFNPKIRADSLSFRVLDRGDWLAGLIFGNNAQTARTFLTRDMFNDYPSIDAQETAGFTTVGPYDLSIGNETMGVDSATQHPLGWTVVQRGKWALHTTDDGTPFAPAHRINRINGAAPKITNKVTSFVNRKVAIYLHHYEAGSASWSTAAQATLVWEGFIRNISDNGDRSLTFTAVHLMDMFSKYMVSNQFTADVAEGVFLAEGQNRLVITEGIDGSTNKVFKATFTAGWWSARELMAWVVSQMVPAVSGLSFAWSIDINPEGMVRISANGMPGDFTGYGHYGLNNLRIGLNFMALRLLGFETSSDQQSESHEGAATYKWSTVSLIYAGTGNNVHDEVSCALPDSTVINTGFSNPAEPSQLTVVFSRGWDAGNIDVTGTAVGGAPLTETFVAGYDVTRISVATFATVTSLTKYGTSIITDANVTISSGAGRVRYELVAKETPIKYLFGAAGGGEYYVKTVRLANVEGTWDVQPVLSAGAESVPVGVEGYAAFGDLEIIGGTYDALTKEFTIVQVMPTQFLGRGFGGKVGSVSTANYFREADFAATLKVKQVWYEKAPIGELIARLLLSTGRPYYNHPDWDVNPLGMAAGVPASLLDIPSVLALGHDFWTLCLTGPVELTRLIESALASYNRYMVWRQGKITLVEPRVDGPAIAVAYQLTNDNKTRPDDRVRAEYATDGVINRVEIKFDKDTGGAFHSTEIVDDVVSQSDFGLQRAVSVECWGVESLSGAGLPAVTSRLAGKVLAFFSRPMTVIERTISKQLMQIVPGDTVLITDPYLINPKTGTRGLTNFPAWVVSANFDPSTMSGKARLAYSGEFPTDKMCPWAWSALVNYAFTNSGYTEVDASNRYLVVMENQYRLVGLIGGQSPMDDTGCVAGDKILIRERSPIDPYNPLKWARTVASVDLVNHRIYLTATIPDWDPDRQYYVTPDVVTAVQHAQLVNTFIADDETDTTGFNPNDSYAWGFMRLGVSAGGPLKQIFVRPPQDGSSAAAGQPLCVGDVADAFRSLNNLMAYRTRHLVWSQVWQTPVETVTDQQVLMAGPVWVPLYGYGSRSILIRFYCHANDATYPLQLTAVASKTMPQGTAIDGYAAGLFVFWNEAHLGTVMATQTSLTPAWTDELVLPCFPETGREPPGVWLTILGITGSGLPGETGRLYGVSAFEAHG